MPMKRPDYNPPYEPGSWTEKSPLTADDGDKESWKTLEDKTPPIIMIGCHRNSEDTKFRDFSLPGAQFDELAIWTRKLQENRSVNELLYLTGGYSKSKRWSNYTSKIYHNLKIVHNLVKILYR